MEWKRTIGTIEGVERELSEANGKLATNYVEKPPTVPTYGPASGS
jgi:hypothetical protein